VMENIAPAVLNGGFSSLLALSLLVTSRSHVFVSFFKIFFMICVFGLFHGLVLLPVVLCMIGPTDEAPSKAPTVKKVSENGFDESHKMLEREKYLRENEQNIQTENEELGVPLHITQEMTQALEANHLRETDLV